VALDVEGTFDLFQDEDLLPKEINKSHKQEKLVCFLQKIKINWYAPFKKEKMACCQKDKSYTIWNFNY